MWFNARVKILSYQKIKEKQSLQAAFPFIPYIKKQKPGNRLLRCMVL
jgi:hypothetical protein